MVVVPCGVGFASAVPRRRTRSTPPASPARAAVRAPSPERVGIRAPIAAEAARAVRYRVRVTPRTVEHWERFLGERVPYPVAVRYGRSRTAPVQLLPGRAGLGAGYLVRLHRFFEHAPDEVAEDLAAWMRAGKRARAACARLDRWIHERCDALPPRTPRAERLTTRGEHHDLEALARDVLARYFAEDFHERPAPAVTWGRRAPSRARRSLRLGSYQSERNLVRVHPVLDSADTPAWFVASVLHHEFLHAAIPDERDAAGRRLHHGPAFRARERRHPDHARSLEWQARHVGRWIRRARRA